MLGFECWTELVYPVLFGSGLFAIFLIAGLKRIAFLTFLTALPFAVRHPQPVVFSPEFWSNINILSVAIPTVLYLVFCWRMKQPWRFDRRVLHEISMRASQLPTRQEKMEYVISEINKVYPQTVTRQEWMHYSSGGSFGSMCLLFANTWEYVMINGSSIPFNGSTGRNPIAYSDTVLDGEALYYDESRPYEKQSYKTGEYVYAAEWDTFGTAVPDHVWFLEYARGFIPYLMPFGFADTLFSTLDYWNLLKIQWVYTKLNIRSMFK